MARQLETVMLRPGSVRHYAVLAGGMVRTLCGLARDVRQDVLVVTGNRKAYTYPTCDNCNRVRAVHDVDTVVPDPTPAAVDAATEVGRVTEVTGRLFRVQGKTDTYTVTIPTDPYLATLCTCMAGKVHPDVQCKHQVAVLAILDERGELAT